MRSESYSFFKICIENIILLGYWCTVAFHIVDFDSVLKIIKCWWMRYKPQNTGLNFFLSLLLWSVMNMEVWGGKRLTLKASSSTTCWFLSCIAHIVRALVLKLDHKCGHMTELGYILSGLDLDLVYTPQRTTDRLMIHSTSLAP